MPNKNLLLGKMVSRGYSQHELAKAIGKSKNTLSAKLNGRRPFDTDEMLHICNVLGITSSDEIVSIFLATDSQNRDESEQNSA